jgi:hypothetical protein
MAGVGQPRTRSPAPCTERASCTNGTGHRTDGSDCAGIIRRVVPRTVPQGRRENGPMAVTERSDQNPPQRCRNLLSCSTGQSNRSSRLGRSLPNRAVHWIKVAPRGAAGPASPPRSASEGRAAHAEPRRKDSPDQHSSLVTQAGYVLLAAHSSARARSQQPDARVSARNALGYAWGSAPCLVPWTRRWGSTPI